MKKTLLFLSFICVINSLSCTPNREKSREYTREEVLGEWEATKTSLRKQKENKVFSFQLNKDSTSIVFQDRDSSKEFKGKWKWNIEKKVGNKWFGISLKCDIFLHVSHKQMLGLSLTEKSGVLYLSAGEYEFKKK